MECSRPRHCVTDVNIAHQNIQYSPLIFVQIRIALNSHLAAFSQWCVLAGTAFCGSSFTCEVKTCPQYYFRLSRPSWHATSTERENGETVSMLLFGVSIEPHTAHLCTVCDSRITINKCDKWYVKWYEMNRREHRMSNIWLSGNDGEINACEFCSTSKVFIAFGELWTLRTEQMCWYELHRMHRVYCMNYNITITRLLSIVIVTLLLALGIHWMRRN